MLVWTHLITNSGREDQVKKLNFLQVFVIFDLLSFFKREYLGEIEKTTENVPPKGFFQVHPDPVLATG